VFGAGGLFLPAFRARFDPLGSMLRPKMMLEQQLGF
jgi:hypothetical protein